MDNYDGNNNFLTNATMEKSHPHSPLPDETYATTRRITDAVRPLKEKDGPLFVVVDSDPIAIEHTAQMLRAHFETGVVLKFTNAEDALSFLEINCFKFWNREKLGNVARKYCDSEYDCKAASWKIWNAVQESESKLVNDVVQALGHSYKASDVDVVIWDADVAEVCPFELMKMIEAVRYPYTPTYVATYSGPDEDIGQECINAGMHHFMPRPFYPYHIEQLEYFIPGGLYKRRRLRY